MEYVRLVFLISELVLIVRSQPTPQGYDDEVEGEMSVPRAPKIIDSFTVNLNYSGMTMNNLQCIVEGSPTPTVFWLKEGKEIQSDTDLYNITYDVTDGKAELAFAKNAYSTNNSIDGNFTCIAANFLGRTQKLFIIAQVSADQQSNSSFAAANSTTTANNNNVKTTVTPASNDATTIASSPSSSIPISTIVANETLVPINGSSSTSLSTALTSLTSGYNSNQTNVISSTVSTASATKILTARLRNSTTLQLPTAPVKESSGRRRSTQNFAEHESSASATRE